MAELSKELLSPTDNPRRLLNISRAAAVAARVHMDFGIMGWKRHATISSADTEPGTEAFDPLVVLAASSTGAQRLPLAAAAPLNTWARLSRNSVGSATIAVVGSQYLQALAPLGEYAEEADFWTHTTGLPPATDVYLEPGQAYIGPEAEVMHTSPHLVTVAAIGRSTLSVEFRRPV